MTDNQCTAMVTEESQFNLVAAMSLFGTIFVGALLLLTIYETWKYYTLKEQDSCFLTSVFYWLTIFDLVATLTEMIEYTVTNFLWEGNVVASMCFDIFSRFSLLFIGYFQGASMLILWIGLS